MDLGSTFGGVMDFAKENPLMAGLAAMAIFMLFKQILGGNSGMFNTAGNAVKAGGVGLLVSVASAMFSDEGIGGMLPDFAKDALGMEDEPEPEIG